jgi:hypothetical protein
MLPVSLDCPFLLSHRYSLTFIYYIPHEWNPFLAINVIFNKWRAVPDIPIDSKG